MTLPTYYDGFTSVQSLSHVRLCDPINRRTPGLPVRHQLPESTQTPVHSVGDAIQPSHPAISQCRHLLSTTVNPKETQDRIITLLTESSDSAAT